MRVQKVLLSLFCIGTIGAQCLAKGNVVLPQNSNQIIAFTENVGQFTDQFRQPRTDLDVKLMTDKGFSVFIGKAQLHYQWMKQADDKNKDTVLINSYRMDVQLLNANPYAELVTEQQQVFKEKYFGSSLTSGKIALACQKLTYKNIYSNIDWILYIKDGKMVYDFIVHPGGKVSDIQLQYSGATSLNLNENGSLSAVTPMGSIGEQAPVCYTQEGKEVRSHFVLNENVLSFDVADYNGTLVIDPTVTWATYNGGLAKDYADDIAVDPWGNTYISGYTFSTDNIATTGAYETTYSGSDLTNNAGDALITKYDCSGQKIWSTYYGGQSAERGWNIATDDNGNVYMAGYTNLFSGLPSMDNLATAASFQPAPGGGDGDLFLVKFDSSGSRIWATYYGGAGKENSTTLPVGLCLDHNGHVYLSGTTNSTAGIATSGSFQNSINGGNDAFLVQFDTTGSRQWSTYYGGAGNDRAGSVLCDDSGNVYMTGITTSATGIATTGSQQSTFGGSSDAFLVKFSSSGSRLWATYYGGTGSADEGMALYSDSALNIYLAGRTNSTIGISTPGAYQPSYGGGLYDAFLSKFDGNGIRQWATYFGGINQGGLIGYNSLQGTRQGALYLTGYARDNDNLSTPGSYQPVHAGSDDAFLAKFEPSGALDWSTYFGGSGSELSTAVATDPFGYVYLAGATSSTGAIATASSAQSTFGGGAYDAFILKFADSINYPVPDTIWGTTQVCNTSVNTYYIDAVAGALSYQWTLPSGWTGNSNTDSITVTTGSQSDTLKVHAVFACGQGGDRALVIEVIASPVIISPVISLCASDSITLSVNVPQGISLQWQKNGMDITGATDTSLMVTAEGIYSIYLMTNTCSDTAAAVTVYQNPSPVITQDGTLLQTTQPFAAYQWNHNGTPITGATAATYNTIADGIYSITVTDGNGCKGTSPDFNVSTPTGIHTFDIGETMIVYPNPSSDRIYIMTDQRVNITLATIVGRTVLSKKRVHDFSVKDVATGLYLLRVTDDQNRTLKITKVSIQSVGH